MKDHGSYSDQAMTALLRHYQPALDVRPVAEAVWQQSQAQPASAPVINWSRRLWTGGGLGLAAAAVLAVLFWPPSLDLPVRELQAGQWGQAHTVATEWNDRPNAVQLQTEGEALTLAAGGRLAVARLTGQTRPGNAYRLTSGHLELDHTNAQTTFQLITPLATIEPLGTRLEATVGTNSLDLVCLAGRLQVQTPDGQISQLAAGQALHLPPAPPPTPVGAPSATLPPATTSPLPPASPVSTYATPAPAPARVAQSAPNWSQTWSVQLAAPVRQVLIAGPNLVLVTDQTIQVVRAATGQSVFEKSAAQAAVAANDNLVVAFSQGQLTAYDLTSGQVRWQQASAPLAFNAPVLAAGGLWTASADGQLYRRSLSDGTINQTLALGSGSYGTPLVEGGRLWVSTLDRRFLALEASSGRSLWSTGLDNRLVGDQPVLLDSTIITVGSDGQAYGLDSGSGRVLWHQSWGSLPWPPVLSADHHLIVRLAAGLVQVATDGTTIPLGLPGLASDQTPVAIAANQIIAVKTTQVTAWTRSSGAQP